MHVSNFPKSPIVNQSSPQQGLGGNALIKAHIETIKTIEKFYSSLEFMTDYIHPELFQGYYNRDTPWHD